MPTQSGGLKLNPHKGYTPGSGFQPVMDMLSSPGSKLSLLTYSSLYGFMFVLDVPKEDSNYIGLNSTYTIFNKTITSFILKFTVITDKSVKLTPFHRNQKMSETKPSFESEASIQQTAWERSVVGGREEICPSVANLGFFDNNESKLLLRGLHHKTSSDDKQSITWVEYMMRYVNRRVTATNILTYLLDEVTNHTYGIGIIVMPNIQNSVTLHAFLSAKKEDNLAFYGVPVFEDDKEYVKKVTVSKILRLFVDIGVVHLDLHKNNILVYYSTETHQFKVLLIDFGRASDITNGKRDKWLKEFDKSLLMLRKKFFFGNPEYHTFRGDSEPISNASTFFKDYYHDWTDFYTLHKSEIDKLLVGEMSVIRGRLSYKTIEKYKNNGWLFNPPPIPDVDIVEYSDEDEDPDSGNRKRSRSINSSSRSSSQESERPPPRKTKRWFAGKRRTHKKLIRASKNKRFKTKRTILIKKRKWTLKNRQNRI